MAYTVKKYSPTEKISPKLPSNYRAGDENKNCRNCVFYSDEYCDYWYALVKGGYLCDRWMTDTVSVPVGEILNNVPTVCNLYYGDGMMRVSSDGTMAIMEIFYQGSVKQLKSLLPEGWIIKHNPRKILIYNLWGMSMPIDDEILLYGGEFKPFMAIISDWDGNKLSATLNAENIHYYETLKDSNWEDYDGNWENYGNTYTAPYPNTAVGVSYQ